MGKRIDFKHLGAWAVASAVLVPFLFQNCSNVGSQQVGFAESAAACTQGIQTAIPTKFLFLIDSSGSTQTTDWHREMREGSISAFSAEYSTKQNFQWGLIEFSNTAQTLTSPAFTSYSGLQTAFTAWAAIPDEGNTDLALAIETAQTAIQNDPDLNSSQNTQYAILLMTDGMPDLETNVDLVSLVKQVVALSPGRITFNTLYFGPYENTAPIELLASMATAGGGHFLNTNANPTGKSFQIPNEINLPDCN